MNPAHRPWYMPGSPGHIRVLALLAVYMAWTAFIEDQPPYAAVRGMIAGVVGAGAAWRWSRLREARI